MKQVCTTVAFNVEILPGVFLLALKCPEIAVHGKPGQFVHVGCSYGTDPLLRRPLSLHRIGRAGVAPCKPTENAKADGNLVWQERLWRPGSGEIFVLFARVGRGTALLAQKRAGDTLNLIGPLGNGFRIEQKARNLLLVAGGLGIAPLIAAADEAIAREMTVTLLAGAKSRASILPAALLPPEIEYVVCTEDGSYGHHGVVTELLPDLATWADQVFACGPRAMIETLAALRLPRNLNVQVSLEEHMACGVGACLGCIIKTRKGLKRVCRDGPVFELGELIWE